MLISFHEWNSVIAAGVGNIIMIRLFVEKKRAQNLDIGMHEQCGTSLTWATEYVFKRIMENFLLCMKILEPGMLMSLRF